MKKVLFTIGMIAILVGVAFAGMAATGKNNGVPADLSTIDAKVTNLQSDVTNIKTDVSAIKSDLANVTRMETISGIAEGTLPTLWTNQIIEQSYDSIRHFHVSCKIHTDWPGGLLIQGLIQDQLGNWVVVHEELVDSLQTYCTDEFDASMVIIGVINLHLMDNPFTIVYAVTMTYATQP
jgi:outer membrane murein-binding lipoprotein Lpp